MSDTEAGRVDWHDSECEQWEGTAIDGVTPLTIACSCGLPELIASREAEARSLALAEVRARVEKLDLDALNPATNRAEVLAAIEEVPR